MKNFTKLLIFTSLFSIAASAQTKTNQKVAPKPVAAKSIVKPTAKPIAKPAEKPATKTSAKSVTKATAKSATKIEAKPAVKSATKTAVKPATKPIAKSVVKAATKPNIKPAATPATKPAVKVAVKPATKPRTTSIEKPAVKPTAQSNAATPVKQTVKTAVDKGEVIEGTYTNATFNFEITLPDEWIIPGDDFEEVVREKGFDLNLQTPKALNPIIQTKLNQTANRVSILFNAFKSVAETDKTAIMRVSVEDLRTLPQVKDAVDYFDLMRETYKNIKLPADFKYSETQAEKLGKMQFAFLDTSNDAGKKRMYATVRNGYAVMFTLTYKSVEDLEAIRNVLSEGNFRLK